MKNKISILTSIILLVFMNSCSEKPKPILKVFNWAMYIGKDTISNFEKENNCQVIYDNYSSNEEMISKIRSGVKYDIIFPTDYAVSILKRLNLLSDIDKSKLSNFKHLDKKFLNLDFDPKNEFSIPYHWGNCGISYNTKKITEPKSYSILWDKKYKNKIAVIDDPRFVIGMILKHLGYSANTIKKQEIDKTKDILDLLMKNIKIFFVNPELITNGDIDIVYGYSAGLLQLQASGKNNIKYVIPENKTLLWFDSMCIPQKSENIELAHKFINYILEPKVIASISNEVFAANANKDSKTFLAKNLVNNPNIYIPNHIMEKAEFIQDLGKNNEIYLDMWQQSKLKNK